MYCRAWIVLIYRLLLERGHKGSIVGFKVSCQVESDEVIYPMSMSGANRLFESRGTPERTLNVLYLLMISPNTEL